MSIRIQRGNSFFLQLGVSMIISIVLLGRFPVYLRKIHLVCGHHIRKLTAGVHIAEQDLGNCGPAFLSRIISHQGCTDFILPFCHGDGVSADHHDCRLLIFRSCRQDQLYFILMKTKAGLAVSADTFCRARHTAEIIA